MIKKIFGAIIFAQLIILSVCTCPNPTLLEQERRDAIIGQQISTNYLYNDFLTWVVDHVEPNGIWYNYGIGAFQGAVAIKEYYELVLKPGGGYGNALGFQVAKLDSSAIPASITKTDVDTYTANHFLNAFFNALPPFDGFSWGVSSYGHYFTDKYTFTPCSSKISHWITRDIGLEVIKVADTYVSGTIDAFTMCGIMSIAQQKFHYEQGFNPQNITGFDFETNPTAGFVDCIIYHAYLTAKGAPCGTNQVDHTPSCFFRHMLTYLAVGALPVHAYHWAKLPANTKCLDVCLPLLPTCHANADPVPGNRVNEAIDTLEYFCQCPIGWKGDGITNCTQVTCTQSSHCQSNRGGVCDNGVCKPRNTYTWDRVNGKAYCPDGSREWRNNSINAFECIPSHKCREQSQCNLNGQHSGESECMNPGNLASDFGICLCHPGYSGGYSWPCVCDSGKTVFQSQPNYKVCLAAGECVAGSSCPSGQSCSSSQPDIIGHCQ
jgi:hypothetical protein